MADSENRKPPVKALTPAGKISAGKISTGRKRPGRKLPPALTTSSNSESQVEPPTLRVVAEDFRQPRVIEFSQSENGAIQKRLDSIENNFRLLDQQLELLETKMHGDPVLSDPVLNPSDEETPRNPR